MTSRRGDSARDRWRRWRHALSPPYQQVLEEAVGDAESVLDVGCGDDSPLKSFGHRRRAVGVDAYAPAVQRSRDAGIHDDYRVADVGSIGALFDERSFDAVVAFDVLEHLEDAAALDVLAAMERIARKRVVVFTPNGYLPQGAREGNPWQVHRSGWTARRMVELGYAVSGVHGIRGLRGEEARIRWHPPRVWHLVSDLTQPIAGRFPGIAFQIVAVKEVSELPRVD